MIFRLEALLPSDINWFDINSWKFGDKTKFEQNPRKG